MQWKVEWRYRKGIFSGRATEKNFYAASLSIFIFISFYRQWIYLVTNKFMLYLSLYHCILQEESI